MAEKKHFDPCWCTFSCGTAKPCPEAPCPEKPCPADNGCLLVCDFVVSPKDGVGPCGAQGSIDLAEITGSTSVCSGDITYSIDKYDKDFFKGASISGSVFTWTTGDETTVNKFSEVRFKVSCKDEDGNCLGFFFCGQIGVQDLCECVSCTENCETCNPCTGTCDKKPGSIKVSETLGGKISIK